MKKLPSLYLFCLFAIFASPIESKQENMRLYCFFSPSHRVFFEDWFLPSLKDDFEMVVKRLAQDGPPIQYSEGWYKTTIHKVELIIQAIQENWEEVFVYADIDIQFFRPFKEYILSLMQGKDMMFQRDDPAGRLCSGFLACRSNSKTLQLWQDVKKHMLSTTLSDQTSLKHALSLKHNSQVRWGILPVEFFCGGTFTTNKFWNPGDILPIPKDIILHHANWTFGIENKIKQLEYVREKVKKQNHR